LDAPDRIGDRDVRRKKASRRIVPERRTEQNAHASRSAGNALC
jgi:hypothetical protein